MQDKTQSSADNQDKDRDSETKFTEAANKFGFDTSLVEHDIGFYNIKVDFNYGCRVRLPEPAYGPDPEVKIRITDIDTNTIIYDDTQKAVTLVTDKKYYVNYKLDFWVDQEHFEYSMDLDNKNVYIKFPFTVLGDVLAWFPYANEFKKKHPKANVYVLIRKDLAELLQPNYPDLIFVSDTNFKPKDCYATYYMGIFFPCNDRTHQPVDFRQVGLRKTAAYILGVEPIERRTHLYHGDVRTIKEPYVCISVHSTTQCKYWNNGNGWIEVISFLKKLGYRVLCIDKQKVYGSGRLWNQIPFGCEDFTGDIPIKERADLIAHADFFVGLSSGLSWVAESVGTPVIMISGFTLPHNEFYTPYRIINYHVCNGCWNYEEFKHDDFGWCPKHAGTNKEFECTRLISSGYVMNMIRKLMIDKGINSNKGVISYSNINIVND